MKLYLQCVCIFVYSASIKHFRSWKASKTFYYFLSGLRYYTFHTSPSTKPNCWNCSQYWIFCNDFICLASVDFMIIKGIFQVCTSSSTCLEKYHRLANFCKDWTNRILAELNIEIAILSDILFSFQRALKALWLKTHNLKYFI